MKKQLLIICLLSFSVLGFSQGIEFEHGTWKEVLAKAQKLNKPIFLDVYTTWCGPCKMMNTEIFPLKEVGKVYNANFICYKVNAEEGSGIQIAKKFKVSAYPTYLYLKPEGTLLFRAIGSMNAKMFIVQSETALAEITDNKSIDSWNKEYINKKKDPTFLLAYINKLSKQDMPIDTVFDKYLQLLSEKERCTPAVAKMYEDWFIKKRRSTLVTSIGYINIKEHTDEFEKLFENKDYANTFLINGITKSLAEAGRTKNEQLFQEVIFNYDSLPKKITGLFKDQLYMTYFRLTGEMGKYMPYAIRYANEHLMSITKEEIVQMNNANLQTYEDQIKSGDIDTTKNDAAKMASIRTVFKNLEQDRISFSLNQIAWNVFLGVSDTTSLKIALQWSGRALEYSPEISTYHDTYANLLYKLGKKEQAITKEKEALRYADKNKREEYTYFEKTLQDMIAGKKTWEKQ